MSVMLVINVSSCVLPKGAVFYSIGREYRFQFGEFLYLGEVPGWVWHGSVGLSGQCLLKTFSWGFIFLCKRVGSGNLFTGQYTTYKGYISFIFHMHRTLYF